MHQCGCSGQCNGKLILVIVFLGQFGKFHKLSVSNICTTADFAKPFFFFFLEIATFDSQQNHVTCLECCILLLESPDPCQSTYYQNERMTKCLAMWSAHSTLSYENAQDCSLAYGIQFNFTCHCMNEIRFMLRLGLLSQSKESQLKSTCPMLLHLWYCMAMCESMVLVRDNMKLHFCFCVWLKRLNL